VVTGYAFFWKKATFERAFGFLDQLKTERLATFSSVTAKVRIDGIDEQRRACTVQPQMMAKIVVDQTQHGHRPRVRRRDDHAQVGQPVKKHPHVDIAIVGSGDDCRSVFDPIPARRFQLLKLLYDDFLHFVLTKRDYEAGSKQQTATEQSPSSNSLCPGTSPSRPSTSRYGAGVHTKRIAA